MLSSLQRPPPRMVATRRGGTLMVRFQTAGLRSAAPTAASDAPPAPPTVLLEHAGRTEQLRLHNGRISVPAIKDAFQLQSVRLDGRLEPCDQLGFTLAAWAPGQTVAVSGAPTGELEQLRAEVAGLRSELAALQELRADLRSVAALGSSLDGMTHSYDELRRVFAEQQVGGGASAAADSDLAVIKRLLAEVVFGSRDTPDFTKTSVEGYSFDSHWQARELARQIIVSHTDALRRHNNEEGGEAAGVSAAAAASAKAKLRSGRAHRHHHDSMDHEEVLGSWHAT